MDDFLSKEACLLLLVLPFQIVPRKYSKAAVIPAGCAPPALQAAFTPGERSGTLGALGELKD